MVYSRRRKQSPLVALTLCFSARRIGASPLNLISFIVLPLIRYPHCIYYALYIVTLSLFRFCVFSNGSDKKK